MKKIYVRLLTFGIVVMTTVALQAQNSNVGIGTVTPDNSAVLDIQSPNKGLLIPRMTMEQRNVISEPANGLMVYQTDQQSGFYFYNGQQWKPLSENDAKSIASDPNDWSFGGNSVGSVAMSAVGAFNQPLRFMSAGYNSGFLGGISVASGNYNNALGANAMGDYTTALIAGTNPTASRNMALGFDALRTNVAGQDNFSMGMSSLYHAKGNFNVAIGNASLLGLASSNGNYNIGVGYGAMQLVGTTGNNNVAIGSQALENAAGSGNIALGHQAGQAETGSGKLYIANSSTPTPLIYGDFSAKFVTIGDVPASNLKRIDAVTAGGYNLLVKGGILTEKVKVALVSTTDWADYVFEPSYKEKMMTLEEIEKYTISNKHLPNVPSAQDMVDKGMEVGLTSKMFMEKIEELTLYMIELNKEVKALKAENELLKKK